MKSDIMCCLLAVCISLLGLRDESLAEDVQSEPVSLGHGDYRFRYSREGGLILEHQSEGERPTRSLRPIVETTGSPVFKNNDRVLDIALSRWMSSSLIGVIHSRDDHGDSFTFVTVKSPEAHGSSVKGVVAKAFGCKPGARIVALSGSRRGDAVTLVVGQLESSDTGGVITSGKILFHGCPDPAPVGAPVGVFTSVVEPGLTIPDDF